MTPRANRVLFYRWLALWFYRRFAVVPKPQAFSFFLTRSSTPMASQYQIHIQPPVAPSHVTKQMVTLTVNGTAQPAFEVPLGSTDFVVGTVSDTDKGSIALDYANALGVAGPVSTLAFDVANDLPVPAPGPFTISFTPVPAPVAPPAV